MPDPYGISATLHTALILFEQTSRQSGRTSRMLEAANPGDTIVVGSTQLQNQIAHKLRELGKPDVEVRVCTPSDNPFERIPTPSGANAVVHFDHTWIYEFYKHQLSMADGAFQMVQRETTKRLPGAPKRPQPAHYGLGKYSKPWGA